MRVLYLNPMGQMGGAERSLLNLLCGFRQIGSELEPLVITTAEGSFTAALNRLDFRCKVLAFPASFDAFGDAGAGSLGTGHIGKFGSAVCSVPGYLRTLNRAIGEFGPAVVHTNGFKMHLLGSWAVPKRNNRPALIGHIHDYVGSRAIAGRLLRAASSRFDGFIANSESVAGDVRTSLKAAKVARVYNSVDAMYRPAGERMNLDEVAGLAQPATPVLRVGLVATFARWKGHLTFLRALARVSSEIPLRGYVVGAPIYRRPGAQFSKEELLDEADRLGIAERIGFTGYQADTASAMRSLDVVIHASTEPEPFGMTIIEAMACGKAVIVSRLGGAAELFEEGITALGHVAGDDQDLAEKIERLARDGALRERLGTQARASVVSRFTNAEMARRVLEIYRDSIKEGATSVEMPEQDTADVAAC